MIIKQIEYGEEGSACYVTLEDGKRFLCSMVDLVKINLLLEIKQLLNENTNPKV